MKYVRSLVGVFAALVGVSAFAELRVSEICPRPDAKDPNGVESGWIELWNDGDEAVDLKDYEIVRVNRGKALKAAGKPLASRTVAAHAYTVVYLSEEYANAKSGDTVIYANDVMVCPYKVNPKKFPLVALYKGEELLEQFVIPVDLPDNQSFAPAGGAFPAYAGETTPGTSPIAVDATPIDVTGALTIDSGSGVTLTDGVYDFSAVTAQKTGVKAAASVTAQLCATNVWSVKFSFRMTTNKATSQDVGSPFFFCRQSGTTPKSGIVAFINNGGLIRVELRDANGTVTQKMDVDSEVNWVDGNWHEMKIVMAGNALTRFALAIDGDTYLDTTTTFGSPLVSTLPICFGHAYDSTAWNLFGGQIKDIAFYKGTLIGRAGGAVDPGVDAKMAIVDRAAVSRVILPTITKGSANNRTGESAYGTNAGPLYGLKHGFSDWQAFPLATNGVGYAVTLAVNPLSDAAGDEITGVKLVYQADFGTIGTVVMTKGEEVAGQGQLWTATIPASAVPAAGHLLRWAAQVTNAAGNMFRTPSFRNPDDGYQWYGTIVEPTAAQVSATLQTWHLFADSTAKNYMDKQYDSIKASLPLGARVGIFDSQTSLYYDNVRIDLRGNTTGNMTKKSHGLRFSKPHPLTCENPFTGEEIEVRKTSLIAEFADMSRVRSSLSMYLRRLAGQDVPFGYPIRVQMNGEFYQLDHHTNRFTDELLEDYYGYDPYGYAFKNVGTLGGANTSGGSGMKQILPDDGTSVTATYNTLQNAIKDVANYTYTSTGLTASQSNNVNKAVVKYYDMPAWLNFLALARLTQECDDGWANLCLYYDRLGNGTWRPLAYDLHQSLGAYYASDGYTNPQRKGLWATEDAQGKSHPFYGGCHVVTERFQGSPGYGNRGIEAVYQNGKYRRLHNRRLRTLMDRILKEPGTAQADTPFWTDCVAPMVAAMQADDLLDRAKWPIQTGLTIYVWPNALTFAEGVQDLWDNYFVRRRTHFYNTHSVTNTAFAGGYARDRNAQIPLAQSATSALKAGFSITPVDGGVVVRNLNAETVDMSGWTMSGAVNYTFPVGSVIDQAFGSAPGEIFVVSNRIAYVAANDATLTDQIILGNAAPGLGDACGLKDANGEVVIEVEDPTPTFYTGDYDEPVSILIPGEYEFSNANFKAGLALGEGWYELKNTKGTANTASNIVCVGSIVFKGKGAMTVEGKKASLTLIDAEDLIVSNGVLGVVSKATSNETAAVRLRGNFAVEDKGTLNLELTKNALSGRGVFLTGKNKFCRIGDGGTLNVTLNGPGSRALQGDKGSVDFEIQKGATVTVTAGETATNARVFKMKGKIKVGGGTVTATATGTGTEIFSSDKSVQISGGTVELAATDDCISAAEKVKISGGRFYGVSSGNDVIDSNQDIEITGGLVLAYTTAVEEDEIGSFGLDVPSTNSVIISGGTVCAIGGVGAHCGTLAGDQNAFLVTGDDAENWSSKYLTFQRKIGLETITTTVGLPAIDVATCTVLYSVPGIAESAAPSVSDVAPAEGSLDFHEVYETVVVRKVPTVESGDTESTVGVDFTRATVDVALTLSDATASTVIKGVLELRDEEGSVVATRTNDFAQASSSWTTSCAFQDLDAGEHYALTVKVYEVFEGEWTELASDTGAMNADAATGWAISYDGENTVGGSWSSPSDKVRQFTATSPSTPKSIVTVDLAYTGEAPDALADLDDWLDYQAGFTPFVDGGVSCWKALTKDGWITLTGVPFAADATNEMRVVFDYRGSDPKVSYRVRVGDGYFALTNGLGEATFDSRLDGTALSAIVHQVGATVCSFNGSAADAALAEVDGVRYTSLADAMVAAKTSGSELKLLWDATLPARLASFKHGNPILVDLNGHRFVNLSGWKIVELTPGHIRLVCNHPIVIYIR